MADTAPITVTIEDEDHSTRVDPETGNIEIDQPDGGTVVQFGAAKKAKDNANDFFANLAVDHDRGKLSIIANELIDAIEADDRSRSQYLATRARALDLLGLELKEPKGGTAESSAPVDGMSQVTNPLLLEALLRGWANTVGELLPADGPLKIKDEGDETVAEDDLAEVLEQDMNWYFTKGAPEYYPDTSHMLLWGSYFGGSGFKKVFRCPMRRRPVSESVDAKDLIVSDTTKDLRACSRITHQIMMRPGVMKRMTYIGAYRDVSLTQPNPTPNAVDSKIAGIQGTAPPSRPEDQPYTIWECQCELDLPEYAPRQFKDEGIPLPFVVTIDKDSREILAMRRDWDEDDEDCTRKRRYIKYPYVPGPGFYGTGLLNILGNSTAAMTAAWREALDTGMYANFPGGLIAKGAARQNTSDFRLSPGTWEPVETNGMDIRAVLMGMPYKDVTPGLLALIDKITAQAKSLGGAADIPSAEGIQNVPVGTMLAQIEQATKVMAAAHKGMHQAQSEEFDLLIDLFRETPEDFWRGNKEMARYWNEQKFLQALDDCRLVPVSDPNVPSHIHRISKGIALLQLSDHPKVGPYLDGKEIAIRCLRILKEDSAGLLIDPPPQQAGAPPVDPAKMIAAQAQMTRAQTDAKKADAQAQNAQQNAVLDAQKIQAQKDIATVNLSKELVIHQHDADMANRQQSHDELVAARQHALQAAQLRARGGEVEANQNMAESEHFHNVLQSHRDHELEVAKHQHDRETASREHGLNVAQHVLDVHQALNPPKPATPAKPKKS